MIVIQKNLLVVLGGDFLSREVLIRDLSNSLEVAAFEMLSFSFCTLFTNMMGLSKAKKYSRVGGV